MLQVVLYVWVSPWGTRHNRRPGFVYNTQGSRIDREFKFDLQNCEAFCLLFFGHFLISSLYFGKNTEEELRALKQLAESRQLHFASALIYLFLLLIYFISIYRQCIFFYCSEIIKWKAWYIRPVATFPSSFYLMVSAETVVDIWELLNWY